MAIRYLSGVNIDSNTLFVDDANNRVGIGTDIPAHKLDINGGSIFLDSDWPIYLGSTNAFIEGNSSGTIVRINGSAGFKFTDGGNTRFLIDTDGNVGINTTNPTSKLHVEYGGGAANGLLVKATTNRSKILVSDNDTPAYVIAENSYASYGMNDSLSANNININVSGNVGIGTTSPGRKLHVDNASGVGEAVISGTTGATLYFRPNASYSVAGNFGIFTTGLTSGTYESTMTIKGYSSAVTDVMTIKGSGNVGIGTTNPFEKLHVNGRIYVTSNPGSDGIVLAGSGSTNNPYAYITSTNEGTQDVGMAFYVTTDAGTTNTEAIRIDDQGNVGIGTTSTNAKLAIKDGSNADLEFFSESSGTALQSYNRTTSTWGYLRFLAGGGEKMRIHTDGNVGIGTTAPNAKLEVAGTGRFTGNVNIYKSSAKLTIESTGSTEQASIDIKNTSLYARWILDEDDLFRIYNQTSSFDAFAVKSSGDIGIGTASPGKKLEVRTPTDTESSIRIRQLSYNYWDLKSPASDTGFTIGDVGGEKLRITSTGNVGIGTTNPGAQLDITKTFNARAGAQSNPTGGASVAIDYQTSSDIQGRIRSRDWDAAAWKNFTIEANNILLSPAGNVGIGTTSPNHKLDIYSNENVPLRIHRPSNANLDSSGAWGIGFSTRGDAINSTTDTRAGIFSYYNGNLFLAAANTSIVADPDAYARLTVLNTGYVGIGTDSPDYKLHVASSGNANIAISAATGHQTALELKGADHWYRLISQPSANSNRFDIYNQTLGVYAFSIASNTDVYLYGNVGINTTNPGARLDVVGDVRVEYANSSTTLSSGGSILRLANSDTTADNISAIDFPQSSAGSGFSRIGVIYKDRTASSEDQDMFFRTIGGGSSAEVMRLTSSGNVGINTTDPTQTLHVDGSARVTGAYYDSNNEAGTSGQVLSSTGSGTDWVSLSEITGVDGTGTANYVSKWSDADTITDSTITDDGTTVTAGVERFKILYQAGIYSFSDTVDASTSEDIFTISNTNGAQAFRVTFVCSTSGYSVAKTYEVVHSYGNTPVAFKVVDSGPYSGNDFDVAFTDAVSNTGIKCAITNNSTTVNANIVTTIFLGGSPTTITVTEH